MTYLLGTAERICAKFTQKTCLVPRSDEFEGRGHHFSALSGAACVQFVFGKRSLASSFSLFSFYCTFTVLFFNFTVLFSAMIVPHF